MAEIKRAIALGFFDGVHMGHAALLQRTKQRAAEIGAQPSVLSFDVHPDNLVFGRETPLINSAEGREDIIRRLFGIENVVFIHFNRHVMQMPWDKGHDRLRPPFKDAEGRMSHQHSPQGDHLRGRS